MPERRVLPLHPPVHPHPLGALLRARGLTYRRGGNTLLDGLSFELPASGITALLGPNGAGKSLLLRALAGLLRPDEGEVALHPDIRGAVALVFQSPVLLRRSVRGNLLHALAIAGVPRRMRSGRLAELLVMADLTRCAERPARALSGGEQQRLAIVRALARQPRLLLLDEPTASLDPRSTAAIEALTRKVVAAGCKVVFVTHDWAQAERLADEVIFLHRGRITEMTPARRFFRAPASEAARAYRNGRLLL